MKFLLDQGACFKELDKLLDDTFRELGDSESANFLLERGASLEEIGRGYDLVDEVTCHRRI